MLQSLLTLDQWQSFETLEEYAVDCEQRTYALLKQQLKAPSGLSRTLLAVPLDGAALQQWGATSMVAYAGNLACLVAQASAQNRLPAEHASAELPQGKEDPDFPDTVLKTSTWSALVSGMRLDDGRLSDSFIDRDSIHVATRSRTVVAREMDEAERMPCAPDFVAAAAVVALGSTIGARCAIKPKARDSWLVGSESVGGHCRPAIGEEIPRNCGGNGPFGQIGGAGAGSASG